MLTFYSLHEEMWYAAGLLFSYFFSSFFSALLSVVLLKKMGSGEITHTHSHCTHTHTHALSGGGWSFSSHRVCRNEFQRVSQANTRNTLSPTFSHTTPSKRVARSLFLYLVFLLYSFCIFLASNFFLFLIFHLISISNFCLPNLLPVYMSVRSWLTRLPGRLAPWRRRWYRRQSQQWEILALLHCKGECVCVCIRHVLCVNFCLHFLTSYFAHNGLLVVWYFHLLWPGHLLYGILPAGFHSLGFSVVLI